MGETLLFLWTAGRGVVGMLELFGMDVVWDMVWDVVWDVV